jgi:hypothetical protein
VKESEESNKPWDATGDNVLLEFGLATAGASTLTLN